MRQTCIIYRQQSAAVVFKGQFSAMTWALIWCQFGQQQAARQQEAVNRAPVPPAFQARRNAYIWAVTAAAAAAMEAQVSEGRGKLCPTDQTNGGSWIGLPTCEYYPTTRRRTADQPADGPAYPRDLPTGTDLPTDLPTNLPTDLPNRSPLRLGSSAGRPSVPGHRCPGVLPARPGLVLQRRRAN